MSESPSSATPGSETSYDSMPYPSAAFPQTHPNRLAAMARLFGVTAVSPAKARVLELGCADGANLLPMAEQYPESSFLGIDSSKVQIATGKAAVAAAGLKNVELRCQDILNFPADAGKFDFIVAHGVFSLVAEPVREKIFEICSDHLTENGLAYISYNALPGWNMRRSLRDMVLYHTASIAGPAGKVQQARALLNFMAESVPTENNAYGMLLKAESEAMGRQVDSYLRHDILEEENTPFYFHEFTRQAFQHGLQYLAEPSLSHMLAGNFPDKVRDTLVKVGNNIVAQEQYMDFLRNRMFRQSILCRATTDVNRNVSTAGIRGFAFQSLFRKPEVPVDLKPGVQVSFATNSGLSIGVTDSFLKAALAALANQPGRAVSYGTLLAEARAASRALMTEVAQNRDQIDEATLDVNLLSLYSKGFLEIHAEEVLSGTSVPERPELTPLMRHQALNARFVTNRLHQSLPADVIGRYVMSLCDGSHTKDQILEALVKFATEGTLKVAESGQPVTGPSKIRTLLLPQMNAVLDALARSGFFPA